jgi:hypothetical protein
MDHRINYNHLHDDDSAKGASSDDLSSDALEASPDAEASITLPRRPSREVIDAARERG